VITTGDDQRLAEVPREHHQRYRARGGAEHGVAGEVLGAGNDRHALLDQLPAAGQARPPPEHRRHDDEEHEQLPHPGQRDAVVGRVPRLRREIVEEHGLRHAEQEAHGAGDAERREAGEQRRCERRHDLERQREPVERGDRGRQHSEPARDDAREHRVRHRQAARRKADEHRRHLVLGRRARLQAETGPAVQRGEHGGGDDHDSRKQEAIQRHGSAEHLDDAAAGEDRRLRLGRRAERQEHGRLEREQDPERRRELRERRRGLQRPEREELHEHAGRHDDDEGDDERRGGREVRAVDARAQRPERVPGEHRDRAGGEVDHT
jgi:hypothetical protein